MKSDDVSRRAFVLAAATTLLSTRAVRAQRSQLTAQQLIGRIRANLGVPWRATSVDGFKAGNPDTVVTGIATTVMATLDVLRRAAGARRNLVITLEPTFYSPDDAAGNRAADPVYLAKKAFIDEWRLMIWRFSDHWNARTPNGSERALAAALGWTGYRASANDWIYVLPETTLASLVSHVRSRLKMRGGLRVVGRQDMRVRTVCLSPGTTDVPSTVAKLPRADVILAGEPREWEAVPYVLDVRSAGQDKGMIVLGRVVSEEPGMRACADWIRSFTTEVPIEVFASADPYWSPIS